MSFDVFPGKQTDTKHIKVTNVRQKDTYSKCAFPTISTRGTNEDFLICKMVKCVQAQFVLFSECDNMIQPSEENFCFTGSQKEHSGIAVSFPAETNRTKI